MNRCRPLLLWPLLLAILMVQGPHCHERPAPHFAEEFGTCDEAGAHWAGHDGADLPDGADACPLCQHRQPPLLVAIALPLVEPVASPGRLAAPTSRPGLGSICRTRCRAPPHA